MLSRRSMFSLFAGAGAIAAGAKVVEAKPIEVSRRFDNVDVQWVPSSDPTPRPLHYYDGGHSHTLNDPGHTHGFSGMAVTSPYQAQGSMFPRGMLVSGGGLVPSVADGQGCIVPVASPEGQEILKSIAAPHAGMSRW